MTGSNFRNWFLVFTLGTIVGVRVAVGSTLESRATGKDSRATGNDSRATSNEASSSSDQGSVKSGEDDYLDLERGTSFELRMEHDKGMPGLIESDSVLFAHFGNGNLLGVAEYFEQAHITKRPLTDVQLVALRVAFFWTKLEMCHGFVGLHPTYHKDLLEDVDRILQDKVVPSRMLAMVNAGPCAFRSCAVGDLQGYQFMAVFLEGLRSKFSQVTLALYQLPFMTGVGQQSFRIVLGRFRSALFALAVSGARGSTLVEIFDTIATNMGVTFLQNSELVSKWTEATEAVKILVSEIAALKTLVDRFSAEKTQRSMNDETGEVSGHSGRIVGGSIGPMDGGSIGPMDGETVGHVNSPASVIDAQVIFNIQPGKALKSLVYYALAAGRFEFRRALQEQLLAELDLSKSNSVDKSKSNSVDEPKSKSVDQSLSNSADKSLGGIPSDFQVRLAEFLTWSWKVSHSLAKAHSRAHNFPTADELDRLQKQIRDLKGALAARFFARTSYEVPSEVRRSRSRRPAEEISGTWIDPLVYRLSHVIRMAILDLIKLSDSRKTSNPSDSAANAADSVATAAIASEFLQVLEAFGPKNAALTKRWADFVSKATGQPVVFA